MNQALVAYTVPTYSAIQNELSELLITPLLYRFDVIFSCFKLEKRVFRLVFVFSVLEVCPAVP